MSKKKESPKQRILVCDDDTGVVEVITIILEEEGHEVITLNSGKAIQKRVQEYLPDVILLDIWMPGIDGKQVTKLLKNNPNTRHIPIIVISALNDVQNLAKEAGADDFLAKPFQMNGLLALVKKYSNKNIEKFH